MKNILLAAMCALLVSFPLFAQEAPEEISHEALQEVPIAEKEFIIHKDMPWSLSGNYEFGANTRKGVASAFGLSLDRFLFNPLLALGLRGNFHNDGNTISATEITLNFRLYAPFINNNVFVFVQWGIGGLLYLDEAREKNTYTMNGLGGCRIYFTRGFIRGFYAEPYFRIGFPFMISGGVAVGHWFNF